MNNNKKIKSLRRRFVTLIEMMIVMFLIALITGVVAYNYRGSLDEGKAFKTKAAIERLQSIISMSLADSPNQDISAWQDMVRHSPLVQNPDSLLTDGWGQPYQVSLDGDGNVVISSERYRAYKESHVNSMFR